MQGIELTPESPVDRLGELGVLAESEGIETVFASCHYNNRDPFVSLARIAAVTDTLEIGPGVANPYDTHPVALASRMATLSELSQGRAVFGLGAGDASTLSNLDVDRARPLRRVLETMQVARTVWAGDRITHDGTFAATDAGLNYAVPQDIPVYIGAQGPDMLRMAAKHADGVLVNAAHPRDVAWAADRLAEGRQHRVRDSSFDAAVYASVSISEDLAAAREAARPPVAFIVGGAPEPVLDRHDIDQDQAEEISEFVGAGDFQAAFGAVTPQMLEAFCVVGTPETVLSRFERLREDVDSIVAAAPLGPDREEAITLLARVFAQLDVA